MKKKKHKQTNKKSNIASLTVYITTNWKILRKMGMPDHLTASRETCIQVRKQKITGHETTDWFQIRKGVCQSSILSRCLFNLYAEYIMRNPGIDETQARIKIARRNVNNLRYADDITLMAERIKKPLGGSERGE